MRPSFRHTTQLPLSIQAEATPRDGRWGATTTNFTHNVTLPIHGWFRFPAGFSAEWVRGIVEELRAQGRATCLLDPFAGVGTSVLAAEEAGIRACGIEAQPFIARIARTKLLWHTRESDLLTLAGNVTNVARRLRHSIPAYPKLIHKCFPDGVLRDLDYLKASWQQVADDSPASELTWLALASILRACSPVGTASWQYIQPKQQKQNPKIPYEAFAAQVSQMASDMVHRRALGVTPTGRMILGDARQCSEIPDDSIDVVITSPPYANNYDYADATRLEMSFFGEVTGWRDLQTKVRHGLIRSCSQHVSAERANLADLLGELAGSPIVAELMEVCNRLEAEKPKHGGKKDYYLMVAAYFVDLNRVWKALRRTCRAGATVCFVIGDSAPYGVHVPVDRWLGELAVAAGFERYRFERLRTRNDKWLNRKHRVPLHEGRLWVDG